MAFHHVAYSTKDLEATRHVYEDLFEFPLVNVELCRDTPGVPRDQEEVARVLAAPIRESA